MTSAPRGSGIARITALLSRPVEWAGAAAAACGLMLVLVVAGNVLARYVLNTGSVAFQELEWHLIPPIALLGMSYALHKGEHVRVDFLYNRFGARARAAVDLLAALLVTALAVIIVVLAVPYVGQSFGMMEGSPDPGGIPYRWVLKSFIPLGFGLLALQGLAECLACGVRLMTGAAAPAAGDTPRSAL